MNCPNELAAMRAQAHPTILDKNGVEWSVAKINNLHTEITSLKKLVKEMSEIVSDVANGKCCGYLHGLVEYGIAHLKNKEAKEILNRPQVRAIMEGE